MEDLFFLLHDYYAFNLFVNKSVLLCMDFKSDCYIFLECMGENGDKMINVRDKYKRKKRKIEVIWKRK